VLEAAWLDLPMDGIWQCDKGVYALRAGQLLAHTALLGCLRPAVGDFG